MMTKEEYKNLAVKAARLGDSKKAENIRILDLQGKSTLTDFVVLMTVESAPQMEAVADEIAVELKKDGIMLSHRDGVGSRTWRVLDYGGVIIHVFEVETAAQYSVDKIYEDPLDIDWEKPVKRQTKKSAGAKKN